MTQVFSIRPEARNELTGIHVKIESGVGIHVDGLPDIQVKESLLRVATAMQSIGLNVPGKKIVIKVVNPSHFFASIYDLPIACAIMIEAGYIEKETCSLSGFILAGELALDGTVRPIPTGLGARIAEMTECRSISCLLPIKAALEGAQYLGAGVMYIRNLLELPDIIGGKSKPFVWDSPEFRRIVK